MLVYVSMLAVTLGLCSGQDAGSGAECDLTFSIPGDQLRRLCQKQGPAPASLARDIQMEFDAVKQENVNLKQDIESLRAEYKDMVDTVKLPREETAVWREVIEWPLIEEQFRPDNDTLVIEDDKTYRDCTDAFQKGRRRAGIYSLKPDDSALAFYAFCDEEGWTVIHRRFDGDVDFYRTWDEYASGFGELSGEFWLGLSNVHMLTLQADYQLMVEALGYNGKLYHAVYPEFYIASEEDDFQLSIGNMTEGNYADVFAPLNGVKFTTHDRDNDEWRNNNCADYYHGAWWLQNCGFDPNRYYCDGRGCMTWGERPVKKFLMKVRPM